MAVLIDEMMTLGEMVSAFRKAKRLSQSDVGRLVGVDGQTISNIETGRTKTLKPANLRRLAEAIGKPIEEVGQAVDAGTAFPPALQRLALEISFPLFNDLRARLKSDEAIHEFCVEAIEERAKKFSLAPGAAKVAQARAAKSRRR